jgi:hypothetical protein
MGKSKKMTPAPSKVKTASGTHLLENIRMKWKIDCDEDRQIIVAKTSGLMSWDDMKKLCEETLAAGRKNNIGAFLVDQKETSLGLSVLEVDRLPDLFRKTGFDLKDRMALLVNSDASNKPLFTFLQDVFTLGLLQVKVFTDPQKAADWLMA